MRADDEQIGAHAGRLVKDLSSGIAFADDCFYGDARCTLRLDECLRVGEQLLAIARCQHERLKTTGPVPYVPTSAGEHT